MIFRLKIKKDQTNSILYFDSVRFLFYDENKTPLNHSSVNFKALNSKTDWNHVKSLTIVLGSKCNFHCDYCLQEREKSDVHDFKISDVEPFLEKLKNNLVLSEITDVELFGGEPLVYWKPLKILIPKLRDILPNLNNYRFVTNGSLLTEEIVQFCKNNKIRIVCSEDGNRNVQRKEREEDNTTWEKYQKYSEILGDGFGIRYCLSSIHPDSQKSLEYFKTKIPNLSRIIDFGVLNANTPKKIIPIKVLKNFENKIETLKTIHQSRLDSLLNPNPLRIATNRIFKDLIEQFKEGKLYAYPVSCQDHIFGTALTIDTLGRVMKCCWMHDKSSFIGNIENLSQIKFHGFKSWRERKNCPLCPVVALCRGCCPLGSDESIELSCPSKFADYFAYFRAILKNEYNADILDIEPIEIGFEKLPLINALL